MNGRVAIFRGGCHDLNLMKFNDMFQIDHVESLQYMSLNLGDNLQELFINKDLVKLLEGISYALKKDPFARKLATRIERLPLLQSPIYHDHRHYHHPLSSSSSFSFFLSLHLQLLMLVEVLPVLV